MFGLLLDDKTAAEAADKIRALKKRLSAAGIRFEDVCPLFLTDNGGEFANVSAFTADADGEIETSLFFCGPYRFTPPPTPRRNRVSTR
jgi:hypothetical protein